MNERLYVVVRSDLTSGDQACQAVHAAVDWCMRYPGIAVRWHDTSNYLVVLAVPDEETLLAVHERVSAYRTWLGTEPDLGNEHTAFAVEHAASRLLSSLPLAFKEPAMVT